eukprot:g1916.t1
MMSMKAVVTTGNGGYEKLEYRSNVTKPTLKRSSDVIVRVLACAVNNTDINTRLGWYAKRVKKGTDRVSNKDVEEVEGDGGWNAETPFPLIQGTDCCGRIESVGEDVRSSIKIGQRVIVKPCWGERWMASDCDGAFAQYVCVPSSEVFPIRCDLSNVELASVPCAFGTAENMLERVKLSAKDVVLIPGASGGVGLAASMLARMRGARVIAICGTSKAKRVHDILKSAYVPRDDVDRGYEVLVGRAGDHDWRKTLARLKRERVSVVCDNVGGDAFSQLMEILERGGRYVTSGAIAGPTVNLDLRTLYLRDLTLLGATAWGPCVFPNLVSYIERGWLRPVVHATYPLSEIVKAQRAFSLKNHVGKIVLVPE